MRPRSPALLIFSGLMDVVSIPSARKRSNTTGATPASGVVPREIA
ncbi:MAG TPA: hypothetical protein VFL57_07355 [Bryobacteraceae bacterium]|nr:hypothetical protein [Bryobacteraceae bacterium]